MQHPLTTFQAPCSIFALISQLFCIQSNNSHTKKWFANNPLRINVNMSENAQFIYFLAPVPKFTIFFILCFKIHDSKLFGPKYVILNIFRHVSLYVQSKISTTISYIWNMNFGNKKI